MKTLKFSTNINCGGCVAKVKPYLDEEKRIQEWNVDFSVPQKILTVSGENIDKPLVEETLKKAGYIIKSDL